MLHLVQNDSVGYICLYDLSHDHAEMDHYNDLDPDHHHHDDTDYHHYYVFDYHRQTIDLLKLKNRI